MAVWVFQAVFSRTCVDLSACESSSSSLWVEHPHSSLTWFSVLTSADRRIEYIYIINLFLSE